MSTELLTNVRSEIEKKFNTPKSIELAGKTIETGMSLFGTDMNRSTHYNTKEELDMARVKIHDQIFDSLGRSIYGCLVCIPGVSDHTKMTAVTKLLSTKWGGQKELLTIEDERNIIDYIISTLPPNRMINLFTSFGSNKINNRRTVRTVLSFILNSPNLEWWAVKYKYKLRTALDHCWGKKTRSSLLKVLKKKNREDKEITAIKNYIGKFILNNNPSHVYEIILFIFSSDNGKQKYTLPLLNKYQMAKIDFSKAEGLPMETIEGVRSIFHKNIAPSKTIEVAKKSMTSKEKKLVQNKASKAGIEVKWDPYSQSLVDLIIYGFKMGFNKDVTMAIGSKAKAAASLLPFSYDHIGILLDDSFSMSGSEDSKLKALAVAYATVEMLKRVGTKKYTIKTTSGRDFHIANKSINASDLASPLVKLLKEFPDAIFVISDGYENAPEGRFNEIIKIARDRLNLSTPIYHFNPVSSAESKVALKRLSDDIPLTPVSNPEKMGLSLFKTMLSVDPRGGILELFNMILPQIENAKDLPSRKAITVKENKVKEIA